MLLGLAFNPIPVLPLVRGTVGAKCGQQMSIEGSGPFSWVEHVPSVLFRGSWWLCCTAS